MTEENKGIQILDTAVVKIAPGLDTEVRRLTVEVDKLRVYSQTLAVLTAEDVAAATNDLSIIANLKKAITAKHNEYKEPIEALLKPVNEVFKILYVIIAETTGNYKGKVLAYAMEEKRKADEAAEIVRLENEAAARKAALANAPAPAPAPLPTAPPPLATTRAEAGTSSVMMVTKWRLADMKLVPREYLVLDSAKITKQVKAGIGSIEGIEIYKEPALRVEANR
jgi:hypothetical protein